MNRVIGQIKGEQPGPLVIFTAGIHGNEQEGVSALEYMFEEIDRKSIPVRGEMLGLRGNLAALQAQRRFIAYDLNRCWTASHMNYLRVSKAQLLHQEDQEAYALIQIIDSYVHHKGTIKVLADLHSTSSALGNFVIVPEYFARHPVIESFQLPVIVNLEHFLEGTLLHYACGLGFLSFAFEGGKIGTQAAVELQKAGIWVLLHAVGAVTLTDVQWRKAVHLLQQHGQGLPNKIKVKSIHKVHQHARFQMKAGYYNFKAIRHGEVLAYDKNGAILSPQNGMIFMPLYQSEGDDGFFIVEETS